MNEVWILVAFIGGVAAGYAIRWFTSKPGNDSQQLQQKLEKTQFQLEQQRQDAADYLEQAHEALLQISQGVDKASRLWNESAKQLAGEQVSCGELPTQAPVLEAVIEDERQPMDYAHGPHGIITPTKKAS
ncbi:YhcB family protein [Ferrimonas aestuarii]|uniref:DUF1043 family protein n=1 Tax=Ferrimonas aestuarii TaxID=2569539 RepID=A0A4U1BRA8_9GAMM|nr:DUF1043 family protein [Ferrimonas aestuarii]TKB55949.1 DUF1043 family protein [Ferrimonas aestuarii]